MADEQTTGTPIADGNGATAQSGTAGDGGNAEDVATLRARLEKLEQEKAQHLAEKTNYEQTARELEFLKQQAAYQQPNQPPTAGGLNEAALRAHQELIQNAYAGDANAIAVVQLAEQLRMLQAQNSYLAEMQLVPDSRKVEVDMAARKWGISPTLAMKMLDGERYQDAQKRIQELEQRQSQPQPRPVATATVPVSAREVQDGKIMKASDYGERLTALKADGRVDEANALRRKVERGEIELAY